MAKATDAKKEIIQKLVTVGRVIYLRVELNGIDRMRENAVLCLECRYGYRVRLSDHIKSVSECGDRVAMTHPYL